MKKYTRLYLKIRLKTYLFDASFRQLWLYLLGSFWGLSSFSSAATVWAATPEALSDNSKTFAKVPPAQLLAQVINDPPPLDEPRPEPILPTPQPIPVPQDLLPIPSTPEVPEPLPEIDAPGTFTVNEFSFAGNTAFSDEELQEIAADYLNRPITLNELFAVRTAITQTYIDAGYINSGAYLPTQRIEDGVAEIRIIEGRLEDIKIEGLGRLKPDYIRSRIAVRTGQPLNVNDLVEALQLLQINPLIQEISAQLAAGSTTGGSVLNVAVSEADVVSGAAILDNGRSPLVGTFRRRLVFSHGNLTERGDRFTVGYSNTDGSNSWDFDYALPINPYNGTLEFFYSGSRSRVIQSDFEFLNVESNSDEVALGVRQPIYQTPRQEFAMGLSFNHKWADSSLQLDGQPREPLITAGSDDAGRTRLSALRFTQEWLWREAVQVAAVRSQFSLGTDWLDATINSGDRPDSEFFSWQGQAQYVRLFDNNASVFLRLNGQWSDRPLLSTEQFRLGGLGSVRGYEQDQVTTDNGIFASAEARFPLMNIPEIESTFQIATFVDYGLGWNVDGGDSTDLLSVGAGLLWQAGPILNLRVDYAVPLLEPILEGDSWQSQGILFTLTADFL